jgi:hypothetical protein
LALGAVLLTGACGDDDDDNPSTPSTPPPAQPTPTPAPTAEPTPEPSPAPPTGNVTGVQGKVTSSDGVNLRVAGFDVDIVETTQFVRDSAPVAASEVNVGDFVRVRGTLSGDGGVITAIRITILTDQ